MVEQVHSADKKVECRLRRAILASQMCVYIAEIAIAADKRLRLRTKW